MLYRWGQVGHRGHYSIERSLAFQDYYERTSMTHVLAVCFLTPVPAIVVSIVIDCIPLRDPSEGWKANYTYWIRDFIGLVITSLGGIAQTQAVVVDGALSNTQAVGVAIFTSAVQVLISIALAATWRFPIPFGYILLTGPYVAIVSTTTIVAIGFRSIKNSSILYGQLKAQVCIVLTQGVVAMMYPCFSVVFYHLSGIQQSVFILIMPGIKFMAKILIAKAAEGLHEYVAMILVFSVDLFNVLYIAVCMQLVKSTVTTVLMMGLDLFHVIVGVRAIFNQINVVRKRKLSGNPDSAPPITSFEKMEAILEELLRESHISTRVNSRIRVFAPFPLTVSNDRTILLRKLGAISHHENLHLSSSLPQTVGSQLSMISKAHGPACLNNKNALSVLNSHKLNQITPADPQAFHPELSPGKMTTPRKGSSPRRLLRILDSNPAISAGKVRAAIAFTSTEAAILDVLQALFHAEYILMAEYIECALPMAYALYLLVMSQLPVVRYYPQVALTFHELTRSVTNILIFSLIEFIGFVGLLVILRRKFGVSPLYQLAFVLETHVRTVQGHLFVWTTFMLSLTLKHHGVASNIDLE